MASSIKIFANVIINFIDKTFLPLLDSKNLQATKAVEQWGQLKSFIYENENIQIWKIQKFILDLPMRLQIPKLNLQQTQKSVPSSRNASFYENDAWKYRASETIQNLQNDRKDNFTQPLLTADMNRIQEKVQTKINMDSFQNLLSSFRKLCTNFQNNHKKLVMDRQGFSH